MTENSSPEVKLDLEPDPISKIQLVGSLKNLGFLAKTTASRHGLYVDHYCGCKTLRPQVPQSGAFMHPTTFRMPAFENIPARIQGERSPYDGNLHGKAWKV